MLQRNIFLTIFFICAIHVYLSTNQIPPKKEPREKKPRKKKEETTTHKLDSLQDLNQSVPSLGDYLVLPRMPLITVGPWPFEGVDYDLLPKQMYDKYNDCYYDHTRCVRNSTWYGWINFVNHCELDLQNCIHRMDNYLGMYGKGMRDDGTFYVGDGWNCYYYVRRSAPDERLNFYYEDNMINSTEIL